ncbi:MAG: hypothetical protein Q9205_003927 [Flavoplaca limonia]
MPVATGHEPVEHELGDFETTINPSYSMFNMPEAPQVEVEEKDRGGDALVQTFYEGPPKCMCCTNWVEKPPPRIPEATQDRTLAQRIEQIEIQSPVIIRAIQPLLTELGGTSYRNYNGSAKAAKEDDEEEYDKDDELKSYHVTGRVIIDPFAFEKFEPGCVTGLEKVEGAKERSEAEKSEQNSISAIFCELAKESRKGLRPSIEAQQLTTTRLRKHRECLCLMSPMLPGFSLKIKKWLSFYVENTATVSWNEEAYDHLVLPEKTKSLLRTFVGNHGQSRANYPDDVVGGKGLRHREGLKYGWTPIELISTQAKVSSYF